MITVVRFLLRKCIMCGRYTLDADKCPACGGEVKVPQPAKYSPDDRYAKYRRLVKEG